MQRLKEAQAEAERVKAARDGAERAEAEAGVARRRTEERARHGEQKAAEMEREQARLRPPPSSLPY